MEKKFIASMVIFCFAKIINNIVTTPDIIYDTLTATDNTNNKFYKHLGASVLKKNYD